jgi:glycolate oxidase FAD binding subunit
LPTPEPSLTSILPPERFGSADDRSAFVADGAVPSTLVFPESVTEVQAAVRGAAAGDVTLLPVGRGAHLGIGMPPPRVDCALSTARLAAVQDHAAADMTVTTQAGVTIAQLNTELALAGQWLPVDPPLPSATTVGGLIAANLNGPLRLSQGGARDLLIGLRVVRADGTAISTGGKVVKNVAGYDLHKAFIGSLGTLGVVVEATFKVRPRPAVQETVAASCRSMDEATGLVDAIGGSPVGPLWMALVSSGVIPTLPSVRSTGAETALAVIGLGGGGASVAAARDRLTALVTSQTGSPPIVQPAEDQAAGSPPRVYAALRDFAATVDTAALCTVTLLPSDVASFVRTLRVETDRNDLDVRFVVEAGIARLHIALDPRGDPATLASAVSALRETAERRRGHLTLRRAAPELKHAVGVWGHIGRDAASLMHRLRHTFDPDGRLSTGRFVPGL